MRGTIETADRTSSYSVASGFGCSTRYPGQPARSLGLRVGSLCYAVRRRQFGDGAASLRVACNLCSELRVPFRPRGQMAEANGYSGEVLRGGSVQVHP